MRGRFELVVFDWDGTLADSEGKIVGCYQAAIAQLGWAPREVEAIRSNIGLSLPETVRALFPERSGLDADLLMAAYRAAWHAPSAPATKLFAESSQLLDALAGDGCTMAVATGKSRSRLDVELEETGVRRHIRASRCADETRSKPHPQMLHELLETTGVRPEDTVMVGDTSFDLEMARSAGVASIAVSWGVHPVERLTGYGPLTVAESFAALRAALA